MSFYYVNPTAKLDGPNKSPISEAIKLRLNEKNKRYFVCDNISDEIQEGELELLIDEVAEKFQGVLDSLVIDTVNDPNSSETARRMAKMYVKELLYGRYFPAPDVKAFPNEGEGAYTGMLVVKSEVKSMCSHHHQPVYGECFIGIIPTTKVIGLSKYSRIVWHESRRGTLQEELTKRIMNRIQEATDSQNVAVYISAKHLCCENRGILSHDSSTQTCSISGMFNDTGVKDEFFKQIEMKAKR